MQKPVSASKSTPSTDEINPELLPGVLAEIAVVTSTKVALRVAASVGGTRAYFPAKPNAEHWLSKLVGHAAALAIGQALAPAKGGLDILVPMGPQAREVARWRTMHRLIDNGLPKREIARAIGCHERVVQRHRNVEQPRVKQALAQGDFFDK